MVESIKVNMVSGDEKESLLEFENDNEDIIIIKLDNKEIGRADWNDNLKLAFERMLKIWSEVK